MVKVQMLRLLPCNMRRSEFSMQKKTKILVDVAARFGIAKTSAKRKLFKKLHDSEHTVKVDDNAFDYRREIVKGEVVPTWIT